MSDPVIAPINGSYFLFATLGENRSGNILKVFQSKQAFNGFKRYTEIVFSDNIARRAGNFFEYKDTLISPAQVCNNKYGEGISLQKVQMNNGQFEITEIKRIYPPTKDYPEGFFLPKWTCILYAPI